MRRARIAVSIIVGILAPGFAAVLLSSCSTSEVTGRRNFDSEESEYREIENLYRSGAYETTIRWIDEYEARSVKGRRWAQILHVRGLAYLGLKKPALAVRELERALKVNASAREGNQRIQHHLAMALYELGRMARALEVLAEVQVSSLDKDLQADHHILRSRIHLKRGLWLEAANEAFVVSKLAPAATPVIRPLIEESLSRLKSLDDVSGLLQQHSDSPLADHLFYRLARLQVSDGRVVDGQSTLRRLVSNFPDSRLYAHAQKLLSSSSREVPSDATQVGVLLPVTGKLAPFGKKALQAIRMGIKTSPRLRGRLHLVVEDSGETPADALAAFDKLVYEHHVMAVLGPLTAKGLEQVAQRSRELGVPLISLARRDIPEGDFLFQAGLTLKQQIEAVAEYAVKKLKQRRFAILYPQDRLGESAAEFFWNAVESLGGEVRAVAAYPSDETDFRGSVDSLTGVSYAAARPRDMDAMARQRMRLGIRGRNKKTDRYYEPPPVVDFDAVFIPDLPRAAGQIIPMFSYRDIESMDFLGTSLWNSPDLSNILQKAAEKRIWFVDVFSSQESEGSQARKFVEQFKLDGGGDATPIEAICFDAAALLADAIARLEGSASREKLRRNLETTSDFSGVTGEIDVEKGVLVRPLKVFTYRNRQVTLSDQL